MGETEPWLCSHGHYQGQDCGECAPMTDLPDDVVNAAAEAIRARGRQLLGPQGPGLSDSKDLAITALAAASGPWAEQLDAANAERDTLRAELDNLRGRVTALADEIDVFYPKKFKQTPSENYVLGWRDLQRKIRAAIVRGSDDE